MTKGHTIPTAILVFGAPKSGKTTFARKFSSSLGAPYLNFNDLSQKYNLDPALAKELIAQIAKSHATLVIEGMLDTEAKRKEVRDLLKKSGYLTVLIWIQTDLNTIKQRILKSKGDDLKKSKQYFETAYAGLEAPSINEKPLVISGKHTYRAQCKNVISRLKEHRI